MKKFFGFLLFFVLFLSCSVFQVSAIPINDLNVGVVYSDQIISNPAKLGGKIQPFFSSPLVFYNETGVSPDEEFIGIDAILVYSNAPFTNGAVISELLQDYTGGLVLTPFLYNSAFDLEPMPERSPATGALNFTGNGTMEILDAAHPIFEEIGSPSTAYWRNQFSRDLIADSDAIVLASDGTGSGIVVSVDGRTISSNICPVVGSSLFEIGTTANMLAYTASNGFAPTGANPVPEPSTLLLFGAGVFLVFFIPKVNFS